MTKSEALKQFNEEYGKLKDSEREIFTKISLKLLDETFIVREKENERKDYSNAKELIPSLRPYFAIMDFALNHDAEKGIIFIKTELDSNRVRLNKLETVTTLVLRSIAYDESRKASINSRISTTVNHVASEITKTEIYNSFDGRSVEFRNVLKTLRRYKLIDFNGDITVGTTPIVIYKTISLVVDSTSLDELNERITKYKGASTNEEDKEIEID